LIPGSTAINLIMKRIEINGIKRPDLGKKATKKLRKDKLVPCEIYGGKENIHFYAHENEFRGLIFTPDIFVVDIKVDGNVYPTIVKEYQFHAVKDNVIHIDFLEIDEAKPIRIAIPVITEGSAIGVLNGGKLSLKRRKLRLKGLVKDIPEQLIVDVTNLKIGKSIKISDLNFDNIELTGTPSEIVCDVKVIRILVEEEEEEGEEEGEEGEEGTEGEATEGTDKPKEGASSEKPAEK
jgi:large subunit ribosomal protein L25